MPTPSGEPTAAECIKALLVLALGVLFLGVAVHPDPPPHPQPAPEPEPKIAIIERAVPFGPPVPRPARDPISLRSDAQAVQDALARQLLEMPGVTRW